MDTQFDAMPDLDELERQGFLLIEGAITPEVAETTQERIARARENGWEDGYNAVGNMWFDTLLDRDEEYFSDFVAHPSVRHLLQGAFGAQCELRSLRCYTNPGRYSQEWHLDFYGYWAERKRSENARYGVQPMAINTSFYLQDNHPGQACLQFVRSGHLRPPPHLDPMDREAFDSWCDSQDLVTLHPKVGDCVMFFSHMPHRGFKLDDDMTRSIVVCHYQVNPMHSGVWHITYPLADQGLFPLTEDTVHAVRQKRRIGPSPA